MTDNIDGTLLIIGGAEDKKDRCTILKTFVKQANERGGKIVILTAASQYPQKLSSQYINIFNRLGAKEVISLDVTSREAAGQEGFTGEIIEAGGIFFTGGDQLRITSMLGGTAVDAALKEAYNRGTVIAGTSAGASVMSATMIVGGDGDSTPHQGSLSMAPGMGLVREVVIDQHFAQRGRLGRLVSAVAQQPAILGIGIDEDTAVLINRQGRMDVIGSQTVTVVDGSRCIHTNVSEAEPEQPLAFTGITVHILPADYGYDLQGRRALFPGDDK
ncbi:MAG: cyanophycinase [Firmicutes bacterium]|nr:cyanophycinase [Bacillota bacterium]